MKISDEKKIPEKKIKEVLSRLDVCESLKLRRRPGPPTVGWFRVVIAREIIVHSIRRVPLVGRQLTSGTRLRCLSGGPDRSVDYNNKKKKHVRSGAKLAKKNLETGFLASSDSFFVNRRGTFFLFSIVFFLYAK